MMFSKKESPASLNSPISAVLVSGHKGKFLDFSLLSVVGENGQNQRSILVPHSYLFQKLQLVLLTHEFFCLCKAKLDSLPIHKGYWHQYKVP